MKRVCYNTEFHDLLKSFAKTKLLFNSWGEKEATILCKTLLEDNQEEIKLAVREVYWNLRAPVGEQDINWLKLCEFVCWCWVKHRYFNNLDYAATCENVAFGLKHNMDALSLRPEMDYIADAIKRLILLFLKQTGKARNAQKAGHEKPEYFTEEDWPEEER